MVFVLICVVSVVSVLKRAVVWHRVGGIPLSEIHDAEVEVRIVLEHIENKLLARLSGEDQISLVLIAVCCGA